MKPSKRKPTEPKEEDRVHVCRARREVDEMVCHHCGIRWSSDEDKPSTAKCR